MLRCGTAAHRYLSGPGTLWRKPRCGYMGSAATFRRETPGADRLAVLALACAAVATFTVGLRKELERPSRPDTAKVLVVEARTEVPRQWAAVALQPAPAVEQSRPRAAVARIAPVDDAALSSAPAVQIASADTLSAPAVATVDAAVVPELPAAAEPQAEGQADVVQTEPQAEASPTPEQPTS